jgi:hypothetical protein
LYTKKPMIPMIMIEIAIVIMVLASTIVSTISPCQIPNLCTTFL